MLCEAELRVVLFAKPKRVVTPKNRWKVISHVYIPHFCHNGLIKFMRFMNEAKFTYQMSNNHFVSEQFRRRQSSLQPTKISAFVIP